MDISMCSQFKHLFNANYQLLICIWWSLYDLFFRYTRAERDLKAARPYGEGAVIFYDRAEVSHTDTTLSKFIKPNIHFFAFRIEKKTLLIF